MLSSQSLERMHRSTWVLALVLATAGCGDNDPTAPLIPVPATPAELTGSWTFSDSVVATTAVEQTVCRNRGIATFAAGTVSTFAEVRLVGTCVSPRGLGSSTSTREGSGVTIVGDSIAFTVTGGSGIQRQTCTYAGRLTGGSTLGASGAVSCSLSGTGTWEMTWGLPEAPRLGRFTAIDIGFGYSCALDQDGQAWCWGENSYAQLGTGDSVPRLVPAKVAGGLRFTQISVADGGPAACGLTGSGQAYCWGGSYGGRLGDGSGAEAPKPVPTPQLVVGGHTFKQIAPAASHTCGITTSGAAYCWGLNGVGELGTGNTTPSSTPVAVSGGLTFTQIDTYAGLTCGVATTGSAYCWGYGKSGALGNGATSNSDVPVLVEGGLKFASVTAGAEMSCGVTTQGDGYCWGSDWGTGSLGTGTDVETETTPVLVAGGLKWKSIRAGTFIACGVTVTNAGYCWGDNFQGAFGAGVTVKAGSNKPVPIAGSLAFDHVIVDWHGCGLTIAGVAYCWGMGPNGQIGDGDLRTRWEPAKVSGQK